MDAEKRNLVASSGLALCLLVAATCWPVMKFGGLIAELDFPDSRYAEWIVSAYIVAEVAFIPIAGRMIDHYGLRKVLLPGFVIFAASSLACTVVPDLNIFTLARIAQGIGAGFCFACAFTAPGLMYPHGERGMPLGMMSLAFALGSLFGAAVGVYFAVNDSWRILFYLPAALVVLGGVVAYVFLPASGESRKGFDVVGSVLLFILIFLGMAYTQNVNSRFDMFSAYSYEMLVLIGLFLIAFYHAEREAVNPVFPRSLRGFQLQIMLAVLLIAISVLGLLQFYVKIYIFNYADLLGTLDFTDGIYKGCGMFLFLIIGAACSSLPGEHIVLRSGVRPWCMLGCAVVALGLALTALIATKGIICFAICLFVLGLGLGMMVTLLLVSLQAIVPREDMGASSSLTMGLRVMALASGFSVYSKYSNNMVADYLRDTLGGLVDLDSFLEILVYIITHGLSEIEGLFHTLIQSFQVCAVFAAVCCILGIFLAYNMGSEDRNLPATEHEKKHLLHLFKSH